MEGRARRDRVPRLGRRQHPSEAPRRLDPRQDRLQEEGRVREERRGLVNLLRRMSGSVPCIHYVFIL